MSTNEDIVKSLIKKRGSIKAKLTLFDKYLTTFEGLDIAQVKREKIIELEQRITSTETLISSFDDIQNEIEYTVENPETHFTEREEFENKFYSIIAKAKLFVEKCTIGYNDDAKSRNSISFEGVNLPKIDLPKFDGSYETWMEFRDIFESMIHDNAQINNIQKFHYLRASLVGLAPRVIQSLEFMSDNYIIAWNTLCDRFNNKQLLIHNHLKAIFNIESMTTATSGKIRQLYENLFKHLNNLKQLDEPVDSWDTLLVYIISSKLDRITAQEWEKQKANYNTITLNDFKEFLKKRANLLETMEMKLEHSNTNANDRRNTRQINMKYGHTKHDNNISRGLVSNTESNNNPGPSKLKYPCIHCRGDHYLFYCPEFLKLSIRDRINKVRELRLCANCLKRNHSSNECNWSGCKICGNKHNTVLHEAKELTNATVGVGQENDCINENSNLQDASYTETTNCTLATAQNAILSTAKVQVRGKRNDKEFTTIRALLDCGSQSSFITSDLCKKLKLHKTKFQLAVSGINDKISYANYKCDVNIQSINSNYTFDLSCFVLDKITTDIPNTFIDIGKINIPINVHLADPEFHIPQAIDLLIGADAFWQLLNSGRINLGETALILQNTRLGWIAAGSLATPTISSRCHLSTNISIQEQLSKFWEVEEVENSKPWSIEEYACERHFVENLSTTEEGRYVVSIPFKESPNKLGESREMAIRRFLSLERKLMSNKTLRKLYTDFLSEYERLGHMTITDNDNQNQIEYFMPHHGVLKESSSSTKLRVVFNASAATSTGLSLNDLQMTGPIIQQDLLSIILRFRTRRIVLSSDIKMMYRQVLIDPEQRKLQKIVWRASPNEPIKTFQLNTVTYGTTAASFLAIRCLHQVADECENDLPDIANIIRNDMYVDDLLTCVDTQEEADYICENISRVLLKRGFELRKWKSNEPNVFHGLNTETTSSVVEFTPNKEQSNKTLGLSWNIDGDTLTYKIQNETVLEPNQVTKRVILSRVATIFDPLGLVSPCIIIFKVMLQTLWKENVTWDEPLPSHILNHWLEISSQINRLNDIRIPRRVVCDNAIHITLHGFADASDTSYGASVYIVSKNAVDERMSNLLCAKSKVAPNKTLTIPRLELCAALVLSQLISKVLKSINIKFENVYCWSDSTIVLSWLRTPPNSLKPFVANRVSEIQKMTDSFVWRHVPTSDNPADIVSRGLEPTQLMKSKLWFHGPSWLLKNENEWPNIHITIDDIPERRKMCLNVSTSEVPFSFERFSNLNKLKHVIAYVLRFLENCKIKNPASRNLSYLTVGELNESFTRIIKIAQRESFRKDYIALQNGDQLSNKSKILSLHPFMDDQGILRVGGRLTNSEFSFSKKHPILLPHNHRLTSLIVENEHLRLLHAGPQLLLSTIRDNFWPISGRQISRKIVRECVKCARYDSQRLQPMMGDLPEARVRLTSPFSKVGVDYAGPFSMKDRRGRGCKTIKCWVALFVCFSTRAIHLEVVLSLTSDDFLQAFNRFISRRGKPSEVFSDNGTNFIKANKELLEMGKFLDTNRFDICRSAANIGIKWHFIPANSPHFGGIWEAGVKSLKHHLRRVLNNHSLFFFDFLTLLTRIEAILNSRPLSPLSSNPDDLTPRTPAHFLIGRPMVSLPDSSPPVTNENRLSQYQLLQRLYEQFWSRWSGEYLSELQRRRCWKKNEGNLEIGQLVLIKDNNLPPSKWRLGRILQLIHGKDGISRVASVKTVDGTLSRAVVRLCPLPVVS